jgi:hypothetical protein
MTERKLTPVEINQLFDFCRKHYVPEYDLQIELVDHLASSIEDQWKINPDIPFPVARINSFDQFGIFGFSKIKSRKEKELRLKYRRLLLKFTLEFYRLPKILLTMALTILLFSIFRLTNDIFWVSIGYSIFAIAFFIYYRFWLFPRYYQIKTAHEKPFMLLNYLKNKQVEAGILFQIPLNLVNFRNLLTFSYSDHPFILFFIAFAITSLSILVYVNLIVLPSKIREHFTEQFPQFVIS